MRRTTNERERIREEIVFFGFDDDEDLQRVSVFGTEVHHTHLQRPDDYIV